MKKWLSDNLWRHAVAISVSFFALFPLYLVVISSFNPTGSLKITSFIPDEFSLVNYKKLFNDPTIPYLVWMKNKNFSPVAAAFLKYINEQKEVIIHEKFDWFEKF
jgi:arabinogalactan oligomer/maltooligosaccharide transport system permease protein